MKILVSILIFLIGYNSASQNRITPLSTNAEISVITIGPGPELYDSFGHTAVRVHDPRRGLDIVFNYGIFDFDTPNFYGKFAQGKLLYKLGVSPFDDFLSNYVAQERSVRSQKLQQSAKEKQALFSFLVENAKEENSKYLYDFLYDNCATRPANAINNIYAKGVFDNFQPEPEGLTHRQLIQNNVPWNSWGSFGMDIAIGSVTDRPVHKDAYLFLPKYLEEALSKAKSSNGNLAEPVEILYNPKTPNVYRENWITSPLIVFLLLGLLILYRTITDRKKNKGITVLDKTLLIITGVIGILLALLWFATEHAPTKWNYNLLWAFPFHLFAGFVLRKNQNKKWLYPYIKLALIMLALMVFHWIVGVQRFPLVLIPLLLAIAYRYNYTLREIKKTRTKK